MTMISFGKYHGLGNDFVLVDERDAPDVIAYASAICDRHHGVGADGVIVCGAPEQGSARMVIYNRDGSRPQMCGNGVRCVVAQMADRGQLGRGDAITIASDAGPRPCRVVSGHLGRWQIEVQMGRAEVSDQEQSDLIEGAAPITWLGVDMGNPHAVTFSWPSIDEIDEAGQRANDAHPSFPEGVNVEFVRERPDGAWEVIVYERGVGRTMACGTGACAVACAIWHTGRAERAEPLTIWLPGGPLTIAHREGFIWMSGAAQRAYQASLDLADYQRSTDEAP